MIIFHMYKISVSKELFKDIQLKKLKVLEKSTSSYWKRELLEPKIINDKIKYSIKQIDKIKITNGLGEEKPQMIIECEKIDYSFKKDLFEFYLGRIIEQKNSDLDENYKDTLIQELLRERALLEDNMNRDHLTGVYNRRKMENDLSMFINQNNKDLLTAIFIDADRFKSINDNFGHDTGDKALTYLAKKIEKYAGFLNGEVYRYGGEEFLILCFLPRYEIESKLNEMKEEIKAHKIYHPKQDVTLTVSIGVSFFSDCKTKDEMLKRADSAVYLAKEQGRDTIIYN
ncbi:GGDEF domain-containing protein [Halarcobacter sp.]|uniref:GGDEF domain-containing protein n=1 Tax=Halarcobacter sp. TaxID=2321133 RepID=UPI003B0014EF